MFRITVGYQVQLGVVVRDKYGNPIVDLPAPIWAVDGGLATISDGGLFAAGTAIGSVGVSATVAGIVGTEVAELISDAPQTVEITIGTPEPTPPTG